MDVRIRAARVDDAYGIAYVAAYSFKETYTGYMPLEYLDGRISNLSASYKKTEKFLLEHPTYLVAEVDNKIVGICYYTYSENDNYKDCGLLGALYVLKDYQDFGIGKDLFKEGIKGLKNLGYDKFYLECLKGNNAIDFYGKYDGLIIEQIKYPISDFYVDADIVLFNDIDKTLSLFESKKLK